MVQSARGHDRSREYFRVVVCNPGDPVGQLLIPFAGLLSRHVKRVTFVLVFWAVWQLFFHLIDTYWIVMPEYPGKYSLLIFASSLCAYVGIGGVLLAVLVRGLVNQNLRPVADPRLPESLAFHNI